MTRAVIKLVIFILLVVSCKREHDTFVGESSKRLESEPTLQHPCREELKKSCAGDSSSAFCKLFPLNEPETVPSVYGFLQALTEIDDAYKEEFICARLIGTEIHVQDSGCLTLLPNYRVSSSSLLSSFDLFRHLGGPDYQGRIGGETIYWTFKDKATGSLLELLKVWTHLHDIGGSVNPSCTLVGRITDATYYDKYPKKYELTVQVFPELSLVDDKEIRTALKDYKKRLQQREDELMRVGK